MTNIAENSKNVKQDHHQFKKLAEQFSLLKLNGKAPIEDKWEQYCHHKRTFDEIGITGNAGIACGPASNLLAVDVDNPQLFESFCQRHNWHVPETRTHLTGKGNPHFLFTYPNDGNKYGNKSLKTLGIDTRGDGGQIVCPGSVHPDTGELYTVAHDIDAAVPPAWLLDLYAGTPQEWSAITTDKDGLLNKYLPQDIKLLIRDGAPKPERSDAIWNVTKALVKSGFSDDQIYFVFYTFPIGAKFFEKGQGRDKWLKKYQIDKARKLKFEATQQQDSAFNVDFAAFHAARFLDTPPPPIEWTLEKSLAKGTLGYLVSDGGVGKGFLSLQLGLSVTTGIPFLDGLYDTGEPGRAVLIFGEDDEFTLHRRLSGIVQNLVDFTARKNVYELLSRNLFLLSVTGQDTRLIHKQDGNLIPSVGYNQLVERMQAIDDLRLVVLDPLSRFYVGDENNTADATYFSSLLEKIAKETGATVLVSAHTNKSSIQGKTGLEALVQHAIRGSTGFTNAARWQMNLAKVAHSEWKYLNLSPNEIHRYLVAKVTKKNLGRPESHFYLKRDEYGTLRHASDVREGNTAQDEEVLSAIVDKIGREKKEGKQYTKVGFANCFKQSWNNYGSYRIRKVIENAIHRGTLGVETKRNGKGLNTDYLTVSVESEGFESD